MLACSGRRFRYDSSSMNSRPKAPGPASAAPVGRGAPAALSREAPRLPAAALVLRRRRDARRPRRRSPVAESAPFQRWPPQPLAGPRARPRESQKRPPTPRLRRSPTSHPFLHRLGTCLTTSSRDSPGPAAGPSTVRSPPGSSLPTCPGGSPASPLPPRSAFVPAASAPVSQVQLAQFQFHRVPRSCRDKIRSLSLPWPDPSVTSRPRKPSRRSMETPFQRSRCRLCRSRSRLR